MSTAYLIGVIGASQATDALCTEAERLGAEIARRGWWLVCGGLGGVMAAACRGARQAGGHTIGILPGLSRTDANPWVEIPIVSGIADARNTIITRTAHACIAVGGSYGTLSEIAFCLKFGTPVVAVQAPEATSPLLEGLDVARSVTDACDWVAARLSTG